MTSYDVIVVGAGSSGCALASRLSEDPHRSVLLLEAGPVPADRSGFPPELLDAGTVRGADPAHPQNWAFDAELVPGRPYSIARGRILGGSSTINGAYFMRARRADFERWSAGGADEWTWERALTLYRRLENDHDFGSTPVHGDHGPMPVVRPPAGDAVSLAFQAAAQQLGFVPEPDKNAQGEPGVGPIPQNVVGGIRWNAGLAYIDPVRQRPNLSVQGDSVVLRVLFSGTRAVGVEVESGGVVSEIRASEIVLCAGAVMSPKLLLVSGIGGRERLERLGIAVVSERPGVGAAFSDHPQIVLSWHPLPGVIDYSTGQSMSVALNFTSSTARQGHVGDLEILPMLKPMGYLLSGERVPGDLALLISVQAETSRGTLGIDSSDPRARPTIDYHYLSTGGDRLRMREAVRTGARLLQSSAFAPVFGGLTDLRAETVNDDQALDDWIRSTIATSIHLCGTAPFGPPEDPSSVVDQYGRVHGVDGLRVADTSILPTAPTRGPAATAILVGELIADVMRRGL